MKAQDVQFMFSEMVQRSEQLFFSPVTDTSDDRLFHLPSFLEALAAIVKEMDEVRAFTYRYFNRFTCFYHKFCHVLIKPYFNLYCVLPYLSTP